MTQPLNENLKKHDLIDLVSHRVHIDEYRSKMGSDADVIVLSFKVNGKEPGLDLVDFIEKAYPFVLDADISSGELDDGEYLVFVELERRSKVVEQLLKMISELKNLVNIEASDFVFKYTKDGKYAPLNFNELSKTVPLTPREYRDKYDHEPLDEMRIAAGLKVPSRVKKNKFTESLQIAAGIK